MGRTRVRSIGGVDVADWPTMWNALREATADALGDEAGAQVSSGVYFYRLSGNDFSQTSKMVMVQ